MYIKNISIVYYLLIGLIGLVVGKVTAWANTVYVEEGNLSFKDFWQKRKTVFKMQYIIMFIIAFFYILLLYCFGFPNNFTKSLDLLKFMLLTPMISRKWNFSCNYYFWWTYCWKRSYGARRC